MRITLKHAFGQLLLLICISALYACTANKEESPVIPPVTSPLSRDYIAFGVIKNSFTHILLDPAADSRSTSYLRRGSLVRILRRQTVRTPSGFVSWVLIEEEEQGWLKEEVMDIYDNESQARTAAESMIR
jgi:hypothetical protein